MDKKMELETDGRVGELTTKQVMERHPCLTAHIIAESMGYATPSCAARILKDAKRAERIFANGFIPATTWMRTKLFKML